MTSPTVLVTGYGGFLGSHVCRLLLESGYRVRGLARNHYPELANLGVEPMVGDASQPEIAAAACQGTEAVIHTAAQAGVWGPWESYHRSNVVATDQLLSAAQSAGCRAFVHSSSPSVTFDGRPQTGIDESVPYPRRWLCHYPHTKAISEQRVLAASGQADLLTCALRPHLLWGEGDPHLIPRVIQRCQQRKLRRIGSGLNRIDTVHVRAAAEAHQSALEKLLNDDTTAAGRAYFITDGAPQGCWSWLCQILEGAGLTPPAGRPIPLRLAWALGAILEGIYAITGRQQEPPMSRFVALQLGVDHFFDITAAKQRLGYQPPGDLSLRFDQMRPWLRQLASTR